MNASALPVGSSEFAPAVRSLDRLAQAYYDNVDGLYDIFGPAFQTEERVARYARATLDAVRLVRHLDVEAGGKLIGRHLGRQIGTFESIIDEQLKRWEWTFLLDDEWEARLKERLGEHDEKYRIPFLRCNLAWRSMPDLTNHKYADELADEAADMGLEPMEFTEGTTAEAVATETNELHKAWMLSPALGPALPTLADGERDRLADASDRTRGFVFLELEDTTDFNEQVRQDDNEAGKPGFPNPSSEPEDVASYLDVLTPTARLFLETSYKKRALSRDTSITLEQLLRFSGAGGGPDSRHVREAKNTLKEQDLIRTRRGFDGGIWLSEPGRAVAEMITDK